MSIDLKKIRYFEICLENVFKDLLIPYLSFTHTSFLKEFRNNNISIFVFTQC